MMIARRIAGWLLLALALVAGGAGAQGVAVDKSEIRFTVKQMGVNFDGGFRKWKADVVFRANALAQSKAEIDVDLGSIDLASPESEAEARGPLWFDTSKFPVAHFSSTSFRDLGGDRYEVAGRLSIKGITRDCIVPIAVSRDAAGNRVASGSFALKRLDYRIGQGEWADPDTVANDIVVKLRMVLSPSA